MRLRVLGAFGASDAEHNLTGYLVDDWLAVDAGTLGSKLSLAQQSRIQAVYITHAHADHIRDLPHLIQNRFNQNGPQLTVFAAPEVIDRLLSFLFNGQVWPDFSKITNPVTGKPAVQYRPMAAGKKVTFGDAVLTSIPVNHIVPAAGVVIELNGQGIVFTGDTGPTKDIWKRANKTPNVVAVVSEASFPNEQQKLADDSGHLSPASFGIELAKIDTDAPIYASHRKVPFERDIESQIRNLRDRRARVLVEKNYTL